MSPVLSAFSQANLFKYNAYNAPVFNSGANQLHTEERYRRSGISLPPNVLVVDCARNSKIHLMFHNLFQALLALKGKFCG